MGLVPGVCVKCGGKILVDDKYDAGICEHCGTPYLNEKVINNYKTIVNNSFAGANVVVNGTRSADDIFENWLAALANNNYESAEANKDDFLKYYATDPRCEYINARSEMESTHHTNPMVGWTKYDEAKKKHFEECVEKYLQDERYKKYKARELRFATNQKIIAINSKEAYHAGVREEKEAYDRIAAEYRQKEFKENLDRKLQYVFVITVLALVIAYICTHCGPLF